MNRVCILLATYNGARWLDEQLDSLFAQQHVDLRVVASDDQSRDDTLAVLERRAARAPLTILPPSANRFGSAHRNFLRLIRDADPADAEYVALSDQDDVWLPGKLSRAVQCLRELPADAYSSDVVAFWPDGRRRLIRKSTPQRRHDFLFGSPGPGCTFVLRRDLFDEMRAWVVAHYDAMQTIWVHDWLIYAFVRARGRRWHIDDQPNMLYRQHGSNEIGVNAGWRAARHRWRHVRSGAYRRDILGIADLVGDASAPVLAVRRLTLADRVWLVAHVREFRRRLLECVLLAGLLLFMPQDRTG